MLVLAVHLTMRTGHDAEIITLFQQLQAGTRNEPGCISYVVQRSRENPLHFLIYEQYRDEAALQEHRDSPHFKQFATNGVFRFVVQRQAELYDPL
jgi:quinol monooxygenase YgiN